MMPHRVIEEIDRIKRELVAPAEPSEKLSKISDILSNAVVFAKFLVRLVRTAADDIVSPEMEGRRG